MNGHDQDPRADADDDSGWWQDLALSMMYDDEPTDSFIGAFLLSLLLSTVFTVLRLCSAISWSWWWILAPAWMPLATLVYVGGPGALFAEGLDRFVLTPMMDRRQRRIDDRRQGQ
jgi:hypothetical protein